MKELYHFFVAALYQSPLGDSVTEHHRTSGYDDHTLSNINLFYSVVDGDDPCVLNF